MRVKRISDVRANTGCGSISRVLRIAEIGQLWQKSYSELNG